MTKCPPRLALPLLAPLVLAGAVLSQPAFAEEAALRVVRDAETGMLRAPNAAEIAALDAASKVLAASSSTSTRKAAAAVTTSSTRVDVLPNGAKRVMLGTEHHAYSVATKTADGGIDFNCVQGEQSAIAKTLAPMKATRSVAPHDKEHAHDSQ
ncbi:post-PEP-CTERM-1 domain-containing protein [Roseateles paludis]